MATTLYVSDRYGDSYDRALLVEYPDNFALTTSDLTRNTYTLKLHETAYGSETSVGGTNTSSGTLPYPGIVTLTTETLPIASEVTISGTVTMAFRGYEDSMSANITVVGVLRVHRPDGTVSVIADKSYGSEVSTSTSTYTTTVTPTSTTLYPGDVLTWTQYIDDADGTTMGAPYAYYKVQRGSNQYLQLTETVTFDTTLPTSTDVFLTSTSAEIGADRLLASETSGGSDTYVVHSPGSYQITQWTDVSDGDTISWYTLPFANNTTIEGYFKFSAELLVSSSASYTYARAKIYVVDADGSNPTQVGEISNLGAITTSFDTYDGYGIISADITSTQRLRIDVLHFSSSTFGVTVSLKESTNTYVQFNTALTFQEGSLVVPPPIVIDTTLNLGIWTAEATLTASAAMNSMFSSKFVRFNNKYVDANYPVIARTQIAPQPNNDPPSWLGSGVEYHGIFGDGTDYDIVYIYQGNFTYRQIGKTGTNTGYVNSQYYSPVITDEVTISGTIAFDISAYESEMNADALVGVRIYKVTPGETFTEIIESFHTSELPTGDYEVQSWTDTPTSTTLYPGDRLCFVFVQNYLPGADNPYLIYVSPGESFIEFTEEISYIPLPTTEISTLYFSAQDSAIDTGSHTKKALSDVSDSATTEYETRPEYQGQEQLTDTYPSGSALEWYSDILEPADLFGYFKFDSYGRELSHQYVGYHVDLFIVDSDGSNPVLIGKAANNRVGFSLTINSADSCYGVVKGTISTGKRIKAVLYVGGAGYPNAGASTSFVASGANSVAVLGDPNNKFALTFYTSLEKSSSTAIVDPIVIDVAIVLPAWITESVSLDVATIASKTSIASGSGASQVINRYVYTPIIDEQWGYVYKSQYSYEPTEDTLVVSGEYYSAETRYRVLVMHYTGTTWEVQQEIDTYTSPGEVSFGFRADISGTTLVVTAHSSNWFNTSRGGAVYIYTRSGTTWTEQQRIAAGGVMETFGRGATLDGDYLVATSGYGEDGYGAYGRIHIYYRASTTFAVQQLLDIPTDANNPVDYWEDAWGGFVFDGDTIAARHSKWRQTSGGTSYGAWFIYRRSGTTWSLEQTLLPDTADDYYYAGSYSSYNTAALVGDTLIVDRGKKAVSYNAANTEFLHVWKRSGTTWTMVQEIARPETDPYYPSYDTPTSATDGPDYAPNVTLSPDETYMYVGFPRSNENDTAKDGFGDPLENWGLVYVYEWGGSQYDLKNVVRNPEYGATVDYGTIGTTTYQDPDDSSQVFVIGSRPVHTAGNTTPYAVPGQIYLFNPSAFSIKHDSYSSPPTIESYVVIDTPTIAGTHSATASLSVNVTSLTSASKSVFVTESSNVVADLTADADVVSYATVSLDAVSNLTVESAGGTIHEVTVSLSAVADLTTTAQYVANPSLGLEAIASITTVGTVPLHAATAALSSSIGLTADSVVYHAPPANDERETATVVSLGNSTQWGDAPADEYWSPEVTWLDGATNRDAFWTISPKNTRSYTIEVYPEIGTGPSDLKVELWEGDTLVATVEDGSDVQVLLVRGRTYTLQVTEVDGVQEGAWVYYTEHPIAINPDVGIIPPWYGEYYVWGIHAVKISTSTVLVTWYDFDPITDIGRQLSCVARINEDLSVDIGQTTPMMAENDTNVDDDVWETLQPLHLGGGKVISPIWRSGNRQNVSGETEFVGLQVDGLEITVLGEYGSNDSEADYWWTDWTVGVSDDNGNGLLAGSAGYYWFSKGDIAGYTLVRDDGPSVTTEAFRYSLMNGYVWKNGQLVTTANGYLYVFDVDWRNRTLEKVGQYTLDGIRDTYGDEGWISLGKYGVDVWSDTDADKMRLIRDIKTDGSDNGTTVFTTVGDAEGVNYQIFYHNTGMFRIPKTESWVTVAWFETSRPRIQYWREEPDESTFVWDQPYYEWNNGIQNVYAAGMPLIDLGKGLFVTIWTPDENQIYVRGGSYAKEDPPPLKMSYRDDDKRAGARRLAYDSENSGDIRLGRVAW